MDHKRVLHGVRLAAAALGAVVWAGCGKQAAPAGGAAVEPARRSAGEVLTVYVPCGMELPLTAAQEAFQRLHPEVRVDVVLDNANVLVQRILTKGERPDLVASPGTVEMEALEKGGAVAAGTARPFGRFDLALFTPRDNPSGITSMADLTKPGVTTIAIADPETNSVGRYTQQALTQANLWEALKPKMLFTDHPITAYKHVAREKAQASFAYRSCPLKTAPEKLEYSKVRIVESVPLDSYEPAYACIGPLNDGARTREFIEFLLSADGQKLLGEHDIPTLPRLNLFVPCGMTGPFFHIQQAFQAKNPGILMDLTYDRAEALSARILAKGEKPDLHFSIGEVERDQLVAAGVVDKAHALPFGSFRLALCANRAKAEMIRSVADLAKPEVGTILLTDTETNSVGFYARKALEHFGQWDAVQSKIAYRPTLKDCYKDIAAGKADAGFAYIGCPLPIDPEKAAYSKVVMVTEMPKESYGGATVYASLLRQAAFPAEAEAFVRFLQQEPAQEALAAVGILPLSATPAK
jgi:molybdate transport system substrate-binding protein